MNSNNAKLRLSIVIFVDRRVKVESWERLLLRVAKADFYIRGLFRKEESFLYKTISITQKFFLRYKSGFHIAGHICKIYNIYNNYENRSSYHCLISSSGWVVHCVLLQKQHQDLRVEQEALSRIFT